MAISEVLRSQILNQSESFCCCTRNPPPPGCPDSDRVRLQKVTRLSWVSGKLMASHLSSGLAFVGPPGFLDGVKPHWYG